MTSGLNHLSWDVVDIEETFSFYVDVLGFVPVMKSKTSAYFTVGKLWIAVVKGERNTSERYDHIAFSIAKGQYGQMVAKLRNCHVSEWKKNESEGESFYFLDPSGNRMEIHVGDLASRIADGKQNWDKDIEWFV